MTVVVTGAAGHLGANLVRALLDAGRSVRCVIRHHSLALRHLDVEMVEGDVCDRRSLMRAFAGAEVVYHAAGRISITGGQGGLVHRINVDGVHKAAEAARLCGVKRFVHFSSIQAFDLSRRDDEVDETSPRVNHRHPVYDQSKAAGEQQVRQSIARGLDAVIINPTGCLGPYDFGPSRMGQVFLDLYDRRLPALVQGGYHWVDMRDVAAGALAAEQKGRTGECYILSGGWCSLRRLAQLAEQVTGVRTPRLTVPTWLAHAGAPVMMLVNQTLGTEPLYTNEGLRNFTQCRQVSTRKAREELGFEPRPLADTVADVYRWFASEGRVTLPPPHQQASPHGAPHHVVHRAR